MQRPLNKPFVILILGLMTALSPFSIDMYLPAFPDIAHEFNTLVAEISLSLSSYFVGLSVGQLFYGPLLDRFGRKPPLYAGLFLYILAALGCLSSHSNSGLVAWRLAQAVGGCAAGVASMAIVRDLFDTRESARVFAILMLILGASPLLAPTAGGFLTATWGWRSVFIVLALMAAALLLTVHFYLPETHTPDDQVSLQLGPILRQFAEILREPAFYTYVVSGALAFAGLFVYLSGSPVIFMSHYGVSAQTYGWIFAIIAAGLIGASQFNALLLRRFSSEDILLTALVAQVSIAAIFVAGTYLNTFNLAGTVLFFFLVMSCVGISNPNSTALALAPFAKNAGSAAALMGFVQMGLGAVASMLVALLGIHEVLPIVIILSATTVLALTVLLVGRARITPASN